MSNCTDCENNNCVYVIANADTKEYYNCAYIHFEDALEALEEMEDTLEQDLTIINHDITENDLPSFVELYEEF